jgi:hypothetical protein
MAAWVPFFLIQCLYNHGRFGSYLAVKYSVVDSGTFPLFSAKNFVALLVDSHNGFLPYNLLVILIAVLGARRWIHADAAGFTLSMAMLAASAVFLSRYPFWNGGLCFGSRLLLFMVPFLAVGLAYVPPPGKLAKAGLGLIGTTGALIQLGGVLVDPLAIAIRNTYVSPETTCPVRLYAGEVGRVLGIPQAPLPEEAKASVYAVHPAFQVPDLWWAHVAYELKSRGHRHP